MTAWSAKLRGVVAKQDGTQVPGTGRVAVLNFRNLLTEYDAGTGTLSIGPEANTTRAEVHAATTAALAANTRSGNTLTADANGALGTIDGVTLTTNSRLLVKDEATLANNGWYYVADPGSASTPWQLTRTADADVSAEFVLGAISKVLSGTSNGGKYFSLNIAGVFTLNSSSVEFVEYFPQSSGIKDAARVATTAALAANTRTGNVLTADANGALAAIDGVTLVLDDRVLVKDEATGANNGIYRVTDLGSAGTPWRMTRAADLQYTAQAKPNILLPVSEGTVNADKLFQLTTNATITLNTTALTFATLAVTAPGSTLQLLYNNAGSIDGASGITVVGSETGLAFATGYIQFGTTPAGAGTLRFPQVATIQFRNNADSANLNVLRLGSTADDIWLGDTVAGCDMTIFAATSIVFAPGGSAEVTMTAAAIDFGDNNFTNVGDFDHDGTNLGFYGTAPTTKQAPTGSRGGNAALASLLTALATIGLITDSTSA